MRTVELSSDPRRRAWTGRTAGLALLGAAAAAVVQPAAPAAEPAVALLEPATSGHGGVASGPATPLEWRARQGLYYKRNWGVEVIGVKAVSSGYMLAFKYLIVDAEKAKLLNDRNTRAFLRDEASGTVLSVPAMENVGELRPGAAPEAGRAYFMIFGNPGRFVKPGNRVSVFAGGLSIDGLIVE